MVKHEQIPEVVWRVAMMTYHREIRRHPEQAWQLAISAAITSWPGKALADGTSYYVPQILILPLPQEKTDG